MNTFLIYGANGYTGELIAKEAVRRGLHPVLAGRNEQAVASLAKRLGLMHRTFTVDDAPALDAVLREVALVLHCAGPFAHTSAPVVDGCLRSGVHYLDITGEIAVFEAIARRDAEAKERGVMLLPGVGFDVVPSDCLAVHLKQRLPSATHLALAIASGTGVSRGTATTALEKLPHGGLVRKGGTLTRVPAAWKTRVIDFGRGPMRAITIPWGDVATAYYSTGIPDIETYLAAPTRVRVAARLVRPLGWLLGTRLLQDLLKKRIRAGPPGPSDEERQRGWSRVWGEVTDATAGKAVSRLHGPDGYTFTVLTALAVVERVLSGHAPVGFQTPAKAYGPEFVLTVPGVERTDE
jgi:short subunit dehydrogenase-like uncharacterized protein